MSKIGYYAVKNGRKPGIYNTWEECNQQILGFPNALFKKFNSYSEAEDFMNGGEKSKLTENTVKGYKAYVDGSFNGKDFSCGVVVLNEKDELVFKFSKKYTNPTYASLHNVAGEIIGAGEAIRWAVRNHIPQITIFYDYQGIEKWPTKEWQAKTDITKKYVEFYDKMSKLINISFVKVKAHSKNKYNDMVDELAKAAFKTSE